MTGKRAQAAGQARQLLLDIPSHRRDRPGRFLVGGGNAEAHKAILAWPDWPAAALVLHGPPACGKTHLGAVWAAHAGGALFPAPTAGDVLERYADCPGPVAIDGVDALAGDRGAETALFHLFNLVTQSSGHLLMTARQPPARIAWALPDLASRLRAAPLLAIRPPDDDLLRRLLSKLFEDRQLAAPPDVVAFLLPRIERSYAGAVGIVARFDQESLRRHRSLTVRLAGEILDGDGGA